MKKSILILVMGFCGTAVFAQNAKSDISPKKEQIHMQKSSKLNVTPQKAEVKTVAPVKTVTLKGRVGLKKKVVFSDDPIRSNTGEKIKVEPSDK